MDPYTAAVLGLWLLWCALDTYHQRWLVTRGKLGSAESRLGPYKSKVTASVGESPKQLRRANKKKTKMKKPRRRNVRKTGPRHRTASRDSVKRDLGKRR